jgi:hypothetical protein
MTTKSNNTGTHMKLSSTNQTGRREAPDSSVRPAKSTKAEARKIAKSIGGLPAYQRSTAATIAAALSIFGGRVIAVEKPTQATA